jgi:hypothetical protein
VIVRALTICSINQSVPCISTPSSWAAVLSRRPPVTSWTLLLPSEGEREQVVDACAEAAVFRYQAVCISDRFLVQLKELEPDTGQIRIVGAKLLLEQEIRHGERRIEAEHQPEEISGLHVYDDVRIANEQPAGHLACSVSSGIRSEACAIVRPLSIR